MQETQKYLESIRSRVCEICIDGIFEQDKEWIRCGLPKDRICPIERYLPQVIGVVESVDSPWMDDYVDALRATVCHNCDQGNAAICDLRLKADCALDTYFMLVTEAIEEVRDRERNQADVPEMSN